MTNLKTNPEFLENAIQQWLTTHKQTSVKPATYERLQISLNLMRRYPIAAIESSRLTDADIQKYINRLVDDGYAQTTIKKQFHLISGYVRYANATGALANPVYAAVNMPSQAAVKKPKKHLQAYTEEEQKRLKSVLQINLKPAHRIILFMLETGIRVGEALSLTWEDVSWQRRALTINKTLLDMTSNTRSTVQNSPKSASSNRVIPLSTTALQLLNSTPKTGTYIFNPNSTEPFSYKVLIKAAKKACKAAQVPYSGMHVFRHTFATNCYYRGCDVKILSKLLGHSSVTVTYNTYIHLFGDALEEMRSVVG